MTHQEQAAFVQTLIANVAAELDRDIKAKITPDTWDGIELRALVAARFDRARMGAEGDRRRWRDFQNEMITRNL